MVRYMLPQRSQSDDTLGLLNKDVMPVMCFFIKVVMHFFFYHSDRGPNTM
jgi:hypothetical protein